MKGPIRILSLTKEKAGSDHSHGSLYRFTCSGKGLEGIGKGEYLYLLPQGYVLKILDLFTRERKQKRTSILRVAGPLLPPVKKGSFLLHKTENVNVLEYLPPYLRTLLKHMEMEYQGIVDIYQEGDKIIKEGYRALARIELAVLCDDRICCTISTYKELVERILEKKRKGDRINLQEVRAKLGYSRRFLLPLFKKMHFDGIIQETEGGRIVASKN